MRGSARCWLPSLMLLLFAGSASAAERPWASYRDPVSGLQIGIPNEHVMVGESLARSDTALGEKGSGRKLFKYVPRNLDAAYHGFYELNVWRAPAPSGHCQADPDETPPSKPFSSLPQSRRIGPGRFELYQEVRGGMSKTQTTIGYRGVVRAACWQFQLMMHQTSAAGPAKAFDTKTLRQLFERFVASVKL